MTAAGARPCPECGTATARPYCAACGLILPGPDGGAPAIIDRAPKEWRFAWWDDRKKRLRLLTVLVVVGLVVGAAWLMSRIVAWRSAPAELPLDNAYYQLAVAEMDPAHHPPKDHNAVVDINTATYDQLLALPAISYRDAMFLLAYRHNRGAFKNPTELRAVLKLILHFFRAGLPAALRQLTVTSTTAAPTDAKFLSLYRRVNLNTVNKNFLAVVPGLGPQVSDRILRQREQKPFRTFDDVAQVFTSRMGATTAPPFDFFSLGDADIDRAYRADVDRFFREAIARDGGS